MASGDKVACVLYVPTGAFQHYMTVYQDRPCDGSSDHKTWCRAEVSVCRSLERGPVSYADDDARWPTRCDKCKTPFTSPSRSSGGQSLFAPSTGGTELPIHEFPAGAMWWAPWLAGFRESPLALADAARKGRAHLLVCLPGGGPGGRHWDVDSKSTNGDGWSRRGEPPSVIATPSILTPSYHGWLGGNGGQCPGYLVEC